MGCMSALLSLLTGPKCMNNNQSRHPKPTRVMRLMGMGSVTAIAILAVVGATVTSNYILHILILAMIWSLVVTAWDLLMGYAGLMNFAQLVFFAIGGYASQMLVLHAGLP